MTQDRYLEDMNLFVHSLNKSEYTKSYIPETKLIYKGNTIINL